MLLHILLVQFLYCLIERLKFVPFIMFLQINTHLFCSIGSHECRFICFPYSLFCLPLSSFFAPSLTLHQHSSFDTPKFSLLSGIIYNDLGKGSSYIWVHTLKRILNVTIGARWNYYWYYNLPLNPFCNHSRKIPPISRLVV